MIWKNTPYLILFVSSLSYLGFLPVSIFLYPSVTVDLYNINLEYYAFYLLYFLMVISMLFLIPILVRPNKPSTELKYKVVKSKFYIYLLLLSFIVLTNCFLSIDIDTSFLFNRLNRENEYFQTQSWVITVLIIQGTIFTGIYVKGDLTKLERMMLILLASMFVFFEIGILGARRFSLAIIIFYLLKENILSHLLISLKGKLLLLTIALVFLFFGAWREILINSAYQGFTLKDSMQLALISNEFMVIGASFLRSIEMIMERGLMYGESIIGAPLIFIPRALFVEKPISLTYEYDIAISIYAEMFLNFQFYSLIIVFVFLVLYYKLTMSSKKSFISLLVGAYAFDFQRAEMSTIIYQLVIVILIYVISTVKLSKQYYD